MKIAMFTNNYVPHVGGVARSVKTLEDQCRRHGHQVLVIAPEFGDNQPGSCGNVLRVPAIRNFHGSDFSVRLPLPGYVHAALLDFAPDVIHSHQPLLMGITALREAWRSRVPIVFTHHTLYEEYVHYVPLDSSTLTPIFKRCAIRLGVEYANRCNQVIAPSNSIKQLLLERGVSCPIAVIPTGVDTRLFSSGDGPGMRRRLGIGPGARVIGHVGRLAQEKNLTFFAEALRQQLQRDPTSKLLVVGDGAAQPQLREQLAGAAGAGQLILTGRLSGRELIDAYAAMDVFAFASQSETQGIVLAEAMAAGKPVVALDAPGVRDILRGGINGIILPGDASAERFAAALAELLGNPRLRRRCQIGAAATARSYSQERCAQQVLSLYTEVRGRYRQLDDDPNTWERLLAAVEIEWQLLAAKMAVAGAAVAGTAGAEVHLE